MADTYLNLGNLYLMQKKFPLAVRHLEHAVSLSRETEYKQGEMQALLLLSDVYKQGGSYEKAFDYLKQSHIVEDSIINIASVNKIAELETVYQAEKTAQQLKVQRYEIQKKNYLLWGFAFIAILLLIAAFNIYNRRQLQNKLAFQDAMMKQQFQASKAVIDAEENERKRIAADLHDGVGQMMSAAKMNLSVFEDGLTFKDEQHRSSFVKLIALIDESCKEIRSVSHQMMPNALLNSGLANAVKEFIDKIDSRIIKTSLHTEGLDERIDSNTETVLYRVIQECVNNVLKHAGASHLDISILKDADGISATIEDNGKGFDSSEKHNFEGIGLKNIISRITYLKGSIDFDSSPGKGTLVAIHIPLG
jgi:signal transduction histidine kinase